jgi:hypothetical protein
MQSAAANRFASVTIFVTAFTFAGFAIWLGINPNALLQGFGIEDRTPQMATEIRAFYGGIEMAIAVAMLLLWRRGDLFAALTIGGLALAGAASGRCLGMVVDGFSPLHAGFAALEAVGATVCLVACRTINDRSSCFPKTSDTKTS